MICLPIFPVRKRASLATNFAFFKLPVIVLLG